MTLRAGLPVANGCPSAAGAAKACRLSGHGSGDVGVSTDLECLHPGDVTGYWLHRGRRVQPQTLVGVLMQALQNRLTRDTGTHITVHIELWSLVTGNVEVGQPQHSR